MLRSLILAISLVFTSVPSVAVADTSDFSDIFVPSERDYSLYIISKIFGNVDQSVLPGEASLTGPELLGDVFGVFNIVTLGLGVLMVLYTLILAVLQTAHHGKMMGEKMSSMWVPIRIAFAIAMLIPKSNGYCLAQVVVMWLVVQGVGAADSLWTTALEYFERGGSLGSSYQGDPGPGSELDDSFNVVYDHVLENLLAAATCVKAHNEAATVEAPYYIQTYVQGGTHHVYFGSLMRENSTTNTSDYLGRECGYVTLNMFSPSDLDGSQERADMANEVHMSIMRNYANEVSSVAEIIASGDMEFIKPISGNTTPPSDEYNALKEATGNYINAMKSRSDLFLPTKDSADYMQDLKDAGWILAGNYYQVLSVASGSSEFTVGTHNTPTMTQDRSQQETTDHKEEIDLAYMFYDDYFMEWDGKGDTGNGRTYGEILSPDDIEQTYDNQAEIFDQIGLTQTSVDHMKGFIETLTGEDGSTDPVLRAAQFGQHLMNVSAKAMLGLAITLPLLGMVAGICSASLPGEVMWNSLLGSLLPIAFGILGFLYVQGATLGVFLPMIPFIIFVVGAIGWIFAVIESMVAAPLVALGMTLPEGHEIYGRAEPAYMLLVNLFLRPSLMILGFICAMLVAWLAVDLLNVSMLSALQFGGVAPDKLFGHYVVSFLYVGVLIAIITKVFSLVNMVPDRVLRWIGDSSTAFMGAEEALSGGRQGGQEMAKQSGDSMSSVGKASSEAGYVAGSLIGKAMKENGEQQKAQESKGDAKEAKP